MTCMCLVSAAWEHRQHRRSSVSAVFIPAVMLRLLIQQLAPCNKQSCSQVLNTAILYAVHTPTQTTFVFLAQLLTWAVFVYDTGMRPKQNYGKLYCQVWFWPPGCNSDVVPGQARSTASEALEELLTVAKQGADTCEICLFWVSEQENEAGIGEFTYFWLCFQFATICAHYFCFDMLRYKFNFAVFCSLIPGFNWKNAASCNPTFQSWERLFPPKLQKSLLMFPWNWS